MLDQLLAWIVVIAPTLFALGIEVVDDRIRKHRTWRVGIMVFGVSLSGLTWWQQSRQIRTSSREREEAVRETSQQVATETSKQVTKAVTEQYSQMVADQKKQITDLQNQLIAQGKDVSVIKGSNIVTGKKPIKVEVTNELPGVGSKSGAAAQQYHPVISVVQTQLKNEADKRKVTAMVALTNSSQFSTTATIRTAFLWNGELVSPSSPPRDFAFAMATSPTTRTEMSNFVVLSQEAYDAFVSGTGKLTVRVTADYPDQNGRTIYLFEGQAKSGLDNLDIVKSDWSYRSETK